MLHCILFSPFMSAIKPTIQGELNKNILKAYMHQMKFCGENKNRIAQLLNLLKSFIINRFFDHKYLVSTGFNLTEAASCKAACLSSSSRLPNLPFDSERSPPNLWHTPPSFRSCCPSGWIPFNGIALIVHEYWGREYFYSLCYCTTLYGYDMLASIL